MRQTPPAADPLISRAKIAELAGVRRPAVTNWERRYPDFPEPVRADGAEYFRHSEMLTWLASRVIPAKARGEGEGPETTYADRARRAEASSPRRGAATVLDDLDSPDDAGTGLNSQRLLTRLTGPLAGSVRGTGTMADYFILLASLIFLRTCAPGRWHVLLRATPPATSSEEARRMLLRIGEETDKALREQGLIPGMKISLGRLQPKSYADLARVIHLSGDLGSDAFRPLMERYEEHVGLKSGEFFTPRLVTQVMADLLTAGENTEPVVIYDPYARGGELLAAAVAGLSSGSGTAQPTVYGSIPAPTSLRFAGMSLALHGVHARLESGSTTPWNTPDQPPHKADYVLLNPPFNNGGAAVRNRKDEDWPYGPPPPGNDNLAWVQHALEKLNAHGRAAIVMPNQAAVSAHPQERDIRRRLVEEGAVECVLALPSQLFAATPIPVSVWFLRQPPNDRDRVPLDEILFIDARQMGIRDNRRQRTLTDKERQTIAGAFRSWREDRARQEPHHGTKGFSVSVPADRIRANDYSLSPGDYVTHKVRPARTVVELHRALVYARTGLDHQHARVDAADAKVSEWRGEPIAQRGSFQSPLPTGWDRSALGDLCEIQAGPSYTRLPTSELSEDGAVPVVLPKHLRDRRIITPDHELAPWETVERLEKFWLEAGDILCVRSGTTGPSALVEEDQTGWILGTNLLRLRPHHPEACRYLPEYLLAYLSLPAVQEWIRNRSMATTAIPSISAASLGRLAIPLPPLNEQHRIGAELAAYDEQIAAHRDLAQAATRARTALAEYLLLADGSTGD